MSSDIFPICVLSTWLPQTNGIQPLDFTQTLFLAYFARQSRQVTFNLNLPPLVNFPKFVPAQINSSLPMLLHSLAILSDIQQTLSLTNLKTQGSSLRSTRYLIASPMYSINLLKKTFVYSSVRGLINNTKYDLQFNIIPKNLQLSFRYFIVLSNLKFIIIFNMSRKNNKQKKKKYNEYLQKKQKLMEDLSKKKKQNRELKKDLQETQKMFEDVGINDDSDFQDVSDNEMDVENVSKVKTKKIKKLRLTKASRKDKKKRDRKQRKQRAYLIKTNKMQTQS